MSSITNAILIVHSVSGNVEIEAEAIKSINKFLLSNGYVSEGFTGLTKLDTSDADNEKSFTPRLYAAAFSWWHFELEPFVDFVKRIFDENDHYQLLIYTEDSETFKTYAENIL